MYIKAEKAYSTTKLRIPIYFYWMNTDEFDTEYNLIFSKTYEQEWNWIQNGIFFLNSKSNQVICENKYILCTSEIYSMYITLAQYSKFNTKCNLLYWLTKEKYLYDHINLYKNEYLIKQHPIRDKNLLQFRIKRELT